MPNTLPTIIVKTPPQLAEEYALAICINEINYAVMMVSPFDLEDYVIGFLFSEQIIKGNNDVHDIDIDVNDDTFTIKINVSIANRCLALVTEKKRQLVGQTSCGICGVEALQQALPQTHTLNKRPNIPAKQLINLRDECQQWQTIATQSGAYHAAFLIDDVGNILHSREDIGRHNALDKLIGYMLSQNMNVANKAILMTSRCSIELVHKTINIGVNHLLSLASPSRLALHIAQQANLNLVHLTKHDGAIFFEQADTEEPSYEK